MAIVFGPNYIGSNSRDSFSWGAGETDGSTGWNTIGGFANQGRLGATYYQNGYIYANILIPQGAIVLTATLNLWSTQFAFGTIPDTVEWKVAGLDVDDAVAVGGWNTNFRPGTGGNNFVIVAAGVTQNDELVLTSDEGGPVTISIPSGTYAGAALATALEAAMNADATLTGSGTITFGVSYATSRFTIDATAGHTIAYTSAGSNAGVVFGFSLDADAAETIISDFDVPGRAPETTAKVDWDRTGFVADTLYTSPDISSVIQEIVGRPGWTSDNSLGLIVRNDGSNIGRGIMRHMLVSDTGNERRSFIQGTYRHRGGQVIRVQTE